MIRIVIISCRDLEVEITATGFFNVAWPPGVVISASPATAGPFENAKQKETKTE
jgi:hypothetical protein